MINFKDYIIEGRDAPLYHGTDIGSFVGIILTNKVDAGDFHNINGKSVRGVSLTRSLNFASAWSTGPKWSKEFIALKFDQAKLVRDYKIKPYNFFNNEGARPSRETEGEWWEDRHNANVKKNYHDFPHGFRVQMEEYLIGDIKNVRKYLTAIITGHPEFKSWLEEYKDFSDEQKKYILSILEIKNDQI